MTRDEYVRELEKLQGELQKMVAEARLTQPLDVALQQLYHVGQTIDRLHQELSSTANSQMITFSHELGP